jgi:hypothetical protein
MHKAMKKTLKNVTPPKYKCGDVDALCPAVYKSNMQTYVIIGKTVDPEKHPELRSRVGRDETAIEISLDLLEDAVLAVAKK